MRDGRLQALLNRLRRVDVDNIEYERLMTMIREDPCSQEKWIQFQFFLKEIVSREAEVTELSVCMEACMKACMEACMAACIDACLGACIEACIEA